MDGHPQIAAVAQNDESAGQGHEKHQNRNETDRDGGRVTFGRGRPLAAAVAIVAAAIAIIVSTRRWRGAAASTADIFDDDLFIRKCGCARHDEFFSLFSELPSPNFILRNLLSGPASP